MAGSTTSSNQVAQIIPPDTQELPQHILEWKGEPAASTSTTFPTTPTQFFNLTGSRRLGSGIISDIRTRAPWYLSDWTDAWNYRVVPATALIFFAK